MTWSELVPLEHAKGPQPIVVSGTIGRPGARPYILIALRPALIHGLPAFLKKPGGIGVSTGSGEHAGRVLLTAKAAGAAHQLVQCTTGKKATATCCT